MGTQKKLTLAEMEFKRYGMSAHAGRFDWSVLDFPRNEVLMRFPLLF